MSKNIILLTSTIKPISNQPQLKLINYLDRLEDYKVALGFYSELLQRKVIDKIVYVDNSGFDLKCHSNIYKDKNIEWVSYYGLDYPESYHRGYGESKLVDYAFVHSSTLNKLDASDKVWRITGRYVIKNLGTIINCAPNKFDFYCNLKGDWVDMELLAWNKKGYKTIIENMWQKLASGEATELILAKNVKKNQSHELKIIKKQFWPPCIVGRRGTDGGDFQGQFTKYKFLLQQISSSLTLPFKKLAFFLQN